MLSISTEVTANHNLQIAVASSSTSKHWANKQITLHDFASKIIETTRTSETYEEYLAKPKSEQGQIKDVGGFVGGTLKAGLRRKENVANLSIMTFDADFADKDFVSRIKQTLPNTAYSIYSTHKHCPAKPRYRLIVYMNRLTLPDEYQAGMRKLAELIGMEYFDTGSFDINRLMYWPSTASDGDFFSCYNEGKLLNFDKLLNRYPDGNWKECALWPTSSRETKRITSQTKRLQEPTEIRGIIGAFCRVYSIHEAITTFLSDDYKTTSQADRYTYTEGSSAGGLHIIEDKFAYSHHETDPARHRGCNAWDLVRVHKYEPLDADTPANTPINRLPSFDAMSEFANGIEKVRADMIKSTIDMFDEFEDSEEGGEVKQVDLDWVTKLEVNKSGIPLNSPLNAEIIFKNCPTTKDKMKFNEFTQDIHNTETGSLWSQFDSITTQTMMDKKYKVKFPTQTIDNAVIVQANLNKYHPLRDYLSSLEWDNTPRCESLLIDLFNCENDAYTRAVTKTWLVAAVARAFRPGVKFDNVLVLQGAQGIGKSAFVDILGKGFSGNLHSLEKKIAVESMQGKWLMELGELSVLSKGQLEQQKSFISEQSDKVRMAYAKNVTEFKRQCVFIGTTNENEYLKDSTGNRRWWPVECNLEESTSIDFSTLRNNVDQIWAEAVKLYKDKTPLYISAEILSEAKKHQSNKRVTDEWEGIIEVWLSLKAYDNRYGDKETRVFPGTMEERDKVCAIEIWEDCLDQRQQMKPYDKKRIFSIVDNLYGERKPIRFGERFGLQRGWSMEEEW